MAKDDKKFEIKENKVEAPSVKYEMSTARQVKQGNLIITNYEKEEHPDINDAEVVLKAEGIRPQGAQVQLYRTFTLQNSKKKTRTETLGMDDEVLIFKKFQVKKKQEVVIVVKEAVPLKTIISRAILWFIMLTLVVLLCLASAWIAVNQHLISEKLAALPSNVPMTLSFPDPALSQIDTPNLDVPLSPSIPSNTEVPPESTPSLKDRVHKRRVR